MMRNIIELIVIFVVAALLLWIRIRDARRFRSYKDDD